MKRRELATIVVAVVFVGVIAVVFGGANGV
jgi:hypothetical protein